MGRVRGFSRELDGLVRAILWAVCDELGLSG